MEPMTLQVLYDGSEAAPEQIPLRAGPLTLVYQTGDLRYICLGEHEILRRVYVAVRDRNWETIPAQLSQVTIEAGTHHFSITYHAEHRRGPIDFAWEARITGAADGTISFSMDGIARSTFLRNRIGFCVLHPIRECAGQPCQIEHTDGTVEAAHFPDAIAPHQPFYDIRAIRHEVVPGVTAEVRFSGEVFEMEDQRNWTDASFKTYCTPLALPFPVQVLAGTRIAQSVILTLRDESGVGQRARTMQARSDQEPINYAIRHDLPAMRLPALGLGIASHGQPLNTRELARLQVLRPAHLRIDLDLGDAGYAAALQRAAAEAQALGARLEVALHCSDAAADELAALVTTLDEVRPLIGAWLVFHRAHKVTPPDLLRQARERLEAYDSAAQFVGGTNAYFTELNRGRPALRPDEGVCFSINPQVHAFDNASLVENLAAQAATVYSARRIYGARPIRISPVTLRPRFNPDATAPDPALAPGTLPPQVDPRQMSLFGAGWTLGSVKYLAEAGAASITYYETTGWRGVMETAAGSPLPEHFRSIPGMVFPLYHVLADLGDHPGALVVPSISGQPLAVEGIVLEWDRQRRVLLANLSATPRRVRVPIGAGQAQVRLLDETTVLAALRTPEDFRARGGEPAPASDGVLELELRPYAIARIDIAQG
jgi:hypothetical protein